MALYFCLTTNFNPYQWLYSRGHLQSMANLRLLDSHRDSSSSRHRNGTILGQSFSRHIRQSPSPVGDNSASGMVRRQCQADEQLE